MRIIGNLVDVRPSEVRDRDEGAPALARHPRRRERPPLRPGLTAAGGDASHGLVAGLRDAPSGWTVRVGGTRTRSMSDAAPSPYSTLPGEGPYDVAIGSALITMVEPHEGHEHAYNRWYEDDHFYSGAMAMPWMFAGRRWVAPVEPPGPALPRRLVDRQAAVDRQVHLALLDHRRPLRRPHALDRRDEPAPAARRTRVPRPHARVHVVPVVPRVPCTATRAARATSTRSTTRTAGSSSKWSTRPTTVTRSSSGCATSTCPRDSRARRSR